jgi:Domain of unknown function (DUF4349)
MLSRERTDDARLRALLDAAVDDPDERALGELLRELRADAPAAPAPVREHVHLLAEREQSRGGARPRSPLRRAALAIAATLVLATLVGGIVTLANTGGGDDGASGGDGGGAVGAAQGDVAVESARGEAAGEGEPARALGGGDEAATLPPSRRRAQDYRAFLRLHVEDTADLSQKTKEALVLTRSYGGYVVSVDYDSADEGMSRLELRIPIRRIQDAVVEYSELGSILAQNVQIVDLQGRIDARSRSLGELRERIGEIRAALREDDLEAAERERLEGELAERRLRLDEVRRERRGIRERASVARVTLELTTADELSAPAPDGFQGALRGAGEILLKELTIILYVLIVGAPVAVLALLALLGTRLVRRRADERLLERA